MQGAKKWLKSRLGLDVSEEKTRVIDLTKGYGEFLGIKIRTKTKGNKKVIVSQMCDKAMERTKHAIRERVKEIQKAAGNKNLLVRAVADYNGLVCGVHNYYQMATDITMDCVEIHDATYRMLHNRLKPKRGQVRKGSGDWERYSGCKRVFEIQGRTILPISYCRHRKTRGKIKAHNIYTPERRAFRHKNLAFPNAYLIRRLAMYPIMGQSIEYNDNRVSLFSGQWGKCAVTGYEFLDITEIHCHHRTPRSQGAVTTIGILSLCWLMFIG